MIILTELFLKDIEIARELAKEIEFLKSYIITSTYNTRLQMHLNDQFMQNSDRGDMNSELRYTTLYDMNILFQRPITLSCRCYWKYLLIFWYRREVLKELVKSYTGQLSKKDIYSYLSSESPGLRIDDFYMVYRAILNTSSGKAKPKKKRKDQLESVFSVMIYVLIKWFK